MYAMLYTCLDVSYALSMASKYQLDPSECHWITVKNILLYLRMTKHAFLIYGGEKEFVINGYTNASFQSNKDNLILQSGYVFYLNYGIVS